MVEVNMFTDEIIVKKKLGRRKSTHHEFPIVYLPGNIVEELGLNIGDDIVIYYKKGSHHIEIWPVEKFVMWKRGEIEE